MTSTESQEVWPLPQHQASIASHACIHKQTQLMCMYAESVPIENNNSSIGINMHIYANACAWVDIHTCKHGFISTCIHGEYHGDALVISI